MVPAEDNAVVIIVGQDMAVISYTVLRAKKLGNVHDIDCTNGNPVNKIFMIYDVICPFRPSISKQLCLSKTCLDFTWLSKGR